MNCLSTNNHVLTFLLIASNPLSVNICLRLDRCLHFSTSGWEVVVHPPFPDLFERRLIIGPISRRVSTTSGFYFYGSWKRENRWKHVSTYIHVNVCARNESGNRRGKRREKKTHTHTQTHTQDHMHISVPPGTTTIDENQFKNHYFASLALPDSLTNIDANAFAHCGRLTSITLPESLTNIGYTPQP